MNTFTSKKEIVLFTRVVSFSFVLLKSDCWMDIDVG